MVVRLIHGPLLRREGSTRVGSRSCDHFAPLKVYLASVRLLFWGGGVAGDRVYIWVSLSFYLSKILILRLPFSG